MNIESIVKDLKKLNLLIVEDGQDIREIMSTTFSKLFKSTRSAVDGVDGLNKFNEEKPDIIITDIRMPNMTGNEMIDAIKDIDPIIPIVVVSGHGRMISRTNKADIILEKPIKFDKLVEAVHTLTK
ncbi:MAG: response regulator [Campylobacterota bacterium]|nr:response regulator [Campylobacterota bacterium]